MTVRRQVCSTHLVSIFVDFQVDGDAQDDATADLQSHKERERERDNMLVPEVWREGGCGDTLWRKPAASSSIFITLPQDGSTWWK